MAKPETSNEQAIEPLADATGSVKWAAIGDTIETTLTDGRVIVADIPNSDCCATANALIESGRWRVSPNNQGEPQPPTTGVADRKNV